MIRSALTLFTALVATPAAQAQDWQIVSNDRASVAMVTFENGMGLGFRCSPGAPLSGFLTGLPPAANPGGFNQRALRLSWGRDQIIPSGEWWDTEAGGTVLNDAGARLARGLRQTGELNIVAVGAGAEGRNVRYVLQAPASWAPLDAFLESCGIPLTEEAPAQPAVGLVDDSLAFRLRYDLRYPAGATASEAVVRLDCATTAAGGLEDCRVIGEIPTGQGFADEALNAARGARLEYASPADRTVPRTRIDVPIRFSKPQLEASGSILAPSRP